jgi:predicted MPP superfamily phosphohydrolase
MTLKTTRRSVLKRLGIGSLGSGVAALATYGYASRIETQQLQLRRATVPLRQIGSSLDGLKIVLMSDFHLYPNTQIELIERAVAMANELRPDLIALAGDYVLGTADSIFELAPVLGGLNARYGVFSILGNHDHWKGETIVRTGLEDSGLTVLQNQGLTLTIGRDLLFLAGIDDGWAGRQDLLKGLENHPNDLPTLLLMHEPDFADAFSADGRISLQLSGHSHGGQVRFPFIGSPFLPPYGRKYDKGLYRIQDMWLYTTCGSGVTAPVRFNCPPEVTEITLVRA